MAYVAARRLYAMIKIFCQVHQIFLVLIMIAHSHKDNLEMDILSQTAGTWRQQAAMLPAVLLLAQSTVALPVTRLLLNKIEPVYNTAPMSRLVRISFI